MLWRRVRMLIVSLVRRSRIESEMSDEIQFHIEARTADLMKRNDYSRSEALRKARLEFGSTEKHKEDGRQARGLKWFDEFRSDLRYAFRSLGRYPAFTFAAIAT